MSNFLVALSAYVGDLAHIGRERRVRSMTADTAGSGEVAIAIQSSSVGTRLEFPELVRVESVPAHHLRIGVTTVAGSRDVGRVRGASRIAGRQRAMWIMAVGAGGRVLVAGLEKLPMATRPELRELIGRQAILTHLVRIGVTLRTDLHDLELGRLAHEPAAMGRFDFQARRISAMAIVASDPPVGVNALNEDTSLVGMADQAAVRRNSGAVPDSFDRRLLSRSRPRRKQADDH